MPDGFVIPGGPGFAGSPQPPDVPCDPTGEDWRGPPGPAGPAGPPGPPGGLGEAPVDGTAYGRLSAAWVHVLPLTGGTLTGALTVGGTLSMTGTGAFAGPHVSANLTNAPRQVNVGTSADGAANDWLYGWTRWFGTITGGDPNSVFQVAANKLIWGDAAEIQGTNPASGLMVYTSTGGVTTAGNTAGRAGIQSYLAVAGQVGPTPTLGVQVDQRAFVSSIAVGYGNTSQGGLGGWNASLNPNLGYYRGSLFAGLDNVFLANGAANWNALIGREIDVELQTGANASTVYGLLLVEGSDKQADGDDHDAITIGSTNYAATHWKNGIAFGGTGLACSVTGALIKTVVQKYPSPHAASYVTGIDFSGATFSDAFLRGPSNNFVVDGQGNTTVGGRLTLPVLTNAANDAAAASAGVPVGGVYRNGSVMMQRVS